MFDAGPSPSSERPRYSRDDFAHSPYVVFYELTRACDLVCQHCRACAQPLRHPGELNTATARRLLSQLAEFPSPPLVVLTGGDPVKRPDLIPLIEHGVSCGLQMALTPSATPLVTEPTVRALAAAGLHRLAVSLDGVDAATHDRFRGVAGSFDRTLDIMRWARAAGLPLQVNTTVSRANVAQLDGLAELLAGERIVLWSVFFLVPVGRAADTLRLSPEEYEAVFERLYHHAQTQPYGIKTTEAPHYRRFLLERRGKRLLQQRPEHDASPRAPLGVNDGKGVMFISHVGEIYPSGFLPLKCGQFPHDSVVDVYQNSPLFVALRDADRLQGKCGACEYRQICGGSRARSFALTGDPLAAEPDCAYQPAGWSRSAASLPQFVS